MRVYVLADVDPYNVNKVIKGVFTDAHRETVELYVEVFGFGSDLHIETVDLDDSKTIVTCEAEIQEVFDKMDRSPTAQRGENASAGLGG